jgi:hypothetical protein
MVAEDACDFCFHYVKVFVCKAFVEMLLADLTLSGLYFLSEVRFIIMLAEYY